MYRLYAVAHLKGKCKGNRRSLALLGMTALEIEAEQDELRASFTLELVA
jgi:hypothetical protein